MKRLPMDLLAAIKTTLHGTAHEASLSALNHQSQRYALKAGLGPYFHHYTHKGLLEAPQALKEALLSADLTSQILTGEHLDALEEILRALVPVTQKVTLLKGIAICQTHYPAPHHRPMGDIDILLPQEQHAAAEAIMRQLGYRQESVYPAEFYQTIHHSMPFFHPRRGVWVEIHHALFPQSSALASDPYLCTDNLAKHTIAHSFRGLQCQRLDEEFQLVYTCAHWAEKLNRSRTAIALLDMVLLLSCDTVSYSWNSVITQLKGGASITSLSLAMLYLDRHGLVNLPDQPRKSLRHHAKNLNWVNRTILEWVLDHHVAQGKPCGRILSSSNVGLIWKTLLKPGSPILNLLSLPLHLLIPPDHPERWSLRFQLGRISVALGFHR